MVKRNPCWRVVRLFFVSEKLYIYIWILKYSCSVEIKKQKKKILIYSPVCMENKKCYYNIFSYIMCTWKKKQKCEYSQRRIYMIIFCRRLKKKKRKNKSTSGVKDIKRFFFVKNTFRLFFFFLFVYWKSQIYVQR